MDSCGTALTLRFLSTHFIKLLIVAASCWLPVASSYFVVLSVSFYSNFEPFMSFEAAYRAASSALPFV